MKGWVAVLAALLAVPLSGEDVKERASVLAVEVALSARDRDGGLVGDLRKEEVRVYEDGKEQKVELFVPIDLRRRGEANLPAAAVRRNFILLFDATFNTPGALLRARDAAATFVQRQLPEGDQAAVYALTAGRGVSMVANFTSDRRLLLSAIESLGLERGFDIAADSAGFFNQNMLGAPIDPRLYALVLANGSERDARDAAIAQWVKDMTAMAKLTSDEAYRTAVERYLETMRAFARALELFPGRKLLIFFSGGFDTKVFGARDMRELAAEGEMAAIGEFASIPMGGVSQTRDLAGMLDQTVKYFASSDCRVYPVDATGLSSDSNLDFPDHSSANPQAVGRRQASLYSLAKDTGGKLFKNMNVLDEALAEILELSDSFYLLTYSPPPRPPKKDPAFHSIRIEVGRAGIDLTYRRGYNDARPFRDLSVEARRLQLAEIIDNDIARDSVSFWAQGLVFPERRGQCPVAISVQVPGEQFEEEEVDLPIEIYAFASGPEGRIESYAHGLCKVPAADTKGRLQESGLRYCDTMLLRPGVDYQIRVLVRNNLTGDVGTRTLKITPRSTTGALAMATPFFIVQKSNWLNVIGYDPRNPPPRAGQAGDDFPVSYRGKSCPAELYPDLQDGGTRALLIKLYNFSSDPTTKRPDVHLNWEILDEAGKVLAAPRFRLLEPWYKPSESAVEFLFQVQGGEFPKSAYWLKIEAGDNQSHQSVAEWIPLRSP